MGGFFKNPRKATRGFFRHPVKKILNDLDPQRAKITYDPKQNDVAIGAGIYIGGSEPGTKVTTSIPSNLK